MTGSCTSLTLLTVVSLCSSRPRPHLVRPCSPPMSAPLASRFSSPFPLSRLPGRSLPCCEHSRLMSLFSSPHSPTCLSSGPLLSVPRTRSRVALRNRLASTLTIWLVMKSTRSTTRTDPLFSALSVRFPRPVRFLLSRPPSVMQVSSETGGKPSLARMRLSSSCTSLDLSTSRGTSGPRTSVETKRLLKTVRRTSRRQEVSCSCYIRHQCLR
mmetsp:Transcript_11353/g.22176  ORF Transcript_11353/g.22176 Transcript_11353/m.22176 type:complete len:212 (+) Transcript_11353:921-1556(+)